MIPGFDPSTSAIWAATTLFTSPSSQPTARHPTTDRLEQPTAQLAQEPIRHEPLSSSKFRKARELVSKIYNAIVTLCNVWPDHVEEPKLEKWKESYTGHTGKFGYASFAGAVNSIKEQGCLNSSANTLHLEALERKYSHFVAITTFIWGGTTELPDQNDKNLLAIPVVIAANPKLPFDRNHIVTFLVDFENKRIEFYDSKGLSIADRDGQRLFHNDPDLSAFLKNLNKKYPGMEIVENTTVHQHDFSHCGVYVSTFLEERASGKPFEQLSRKGAAPTTQEALTTARTKMLTTMAENPPAAATNIPLGNSVSPVQLIDGWNIP